MKKYIRQAIISNLILITLISFPLANTMSKTIEVKKMNGEKIFLDGKLDESAWIFTDNSSNFIQRDPLEGKPATESTSFAILYDDENLYVAIRAQTTDNSTIKGILSRRDEESPSDWLYVSIDSYNDNRTAFEFGLNPVGVKRDLRRFDDANQDINWDANWEGKTSIDKDGWYAEFKIPFRELRFDNEDNKVWGIQINRYIAENNEVSYWAYWPKNESGYVQHYGDLTGLSDIPKQKRVYLMPYVTSSYTKADFLKNPVHPNSFDYGNSLGLDARIGLTNNLTFDLTINPDFGQVEADPAELNLSAFESYFMEKRQFFVEGGNIFNFSLGLGDGNQSSNSLFYTRRIGRTPHHYVEDDDGWESNPTATRILTAGKISGKTSSGWSIGVLDAVTARETGTVKFEEGLPSIQETAEPLTNYFVSRVQKDLREGRTTVGGIFTAINRNIEDDHLNFLHTKAYTAGLDFDHYLFDNKYEIEGAFAFTDVFGSQEALLETQTNSRHYFQRTGADHLTVDSTATNLRGFAHKFAFSKIRGDHWRASFGEWAFSPGFEANDLGFHRQTDTQVQFLWAQYRQDDPGKYIRSHRTNFNLWKGNTFGNESTGKGGNVNGNLTFVNYWSTGGGIGFNLPGYHTTATWGGPAVKTSSRLNFWGFIASDDRKPINIEVFGYRGGNGSGSNWFGVEPNVNWRPTKNFSLRATLGFNQMHDSWAFWSDYEPLEDLQTGNFDYLMVEMDQKTISATLRLDLTLTPNLSIQYYGSPFITAGKYKNFKKLIDPDADAFSDRFLDYDRSDQFYNEQNEAWEIDYNNDGIVNYELSNLDFNYKQFNSNLVIRWEYKTGSTIYLVWSQGVSDEIENGAFNYSRDLNNLFKADIENVVLLKFSYLLNI
ncbi:MAG: DUF5916 domain-containing protein [Candidatus Neomarinimicrobiota bacterium]